MENVSKGGIILPESAIEKKRETKGVVLSVGKGRFNDLGNRIPLAVKVGDVVLYGDYAGTDIKTAEGEFLLMSEDDVIAVLVDE